MPNARRGAELEDMAGVLAQLQELGFGKPRGPLGRVGGALMAYANAETERSIVRLAGLRPAESAVVLGPGPGIGLHAAGVACGDVVGVEPSELMRASSRRRCAELIRRGRVRVVEGDAEHTGLADTSIDVVLSVNNVMLWPDPAAGFAEAFRVLRPDGRLLVSAHQRALDGGLPALREAVVAAGFTDVQTWTWQPPEGTMLAAQLRAAKPSRRQPSSEHAGNSSMVG